MPNENDKSISNVKSQKSNYKIFVIWNFGFDLTFGF